MIPVMNGGLGRKDEGRRTKDLYARFLKSREADDSKFRGLKIPGLRMLAE
jgi:hypothetical protein